MIDYLDKGTKIGGGRLFSARELFELGDAGAFDSHEGDALQRAVKALSPDARYELIALMWLGRGEPEPFPEQVAYARKNTDAGDVNYILEKPLYEYLPAGLKALGLPGSREP